MHFFLRFSHLGMKMSIGSRWFYIKNAPGHVREGRFTFSSIKSRRINIQKIMSFKKHQNKAVRLRC